jgi:hypothetical protein
MAKGEIYVDASDITEVNGFLERNLDGFNTLIFLRVTDRSIYDELVDGDTNNLRLTDTVVNRRKKDYKTKKMSLVFHDSILIAKNSNDMSVVFMNSRKNWVKDDQKRKNKLDRLFDKED